MSRFARYFSVNLWGGNRVGGWQQVVDGDQFFGFIYEELFSLWKKKVQSNYSEPRCSCAGVVKRFYDSYIAMTPRRGKSGGGAKRRTSACSVTNGLRPVYIRSRSFAVRAAAAFLVYALPRKERASPDLYTGQELRPPNPGKWINQRFPNKISLTNL